MKGNITSISHWTIYALVFNLILSINVFAKPYVNQEITEQVLNKLKVKNFDTMIINYDQPNAYLYQSKFLIITSALADLIKNSDELSYVLAHEAAHYLFEQIDYQSTELEADLLAFEIMKNAGFKVDAAKQLQERISRFYSLSDT